MDPAAYVVMAEEESTHWWFSGRRTILSTVIGRLDLPEKSRILEIGCGTGGNLQMLAGFGDVSAFEMDVQARAMASKKTAGRYDIRAGQCPHEIPFNGQRFDLICMFDVLEHIEQDVETLTAIRSLLADNGRILITVPAYQWLYGTHDIFLHHKRRYSSRELHSKIAVAGLRCTRMSHMNMFLFPLAAAARIKDRLFPGATATGAHPPAAIINGVFENVFSSERHLLKLLDLPFGVSLLCVLEAV